MATQESRPFSGPEAASSKPIDVFVSYSHQDEALHDELAKHLKALEYEGIIRPWHDRKITAGKDFSKEIDIMLNRASFILLLVSPDFIASEYCWGREMKRAMERHDAGEARVIPIILRPVDWHQTPFRQLLALPKDGKAVTSWTNRDDALVDIARGIRAAATELVAGTPERATVTLAVRALAYTTQYRGAIIEVDIGNRGSAPQQITDCSLEIPSLETTLEHAPGPPNLTGGEPWLPHTPIPLGPRKLTRGALFFPAGMGPLRNGLRSEPLRARLRLEFFLEPPIAQDLEIYTFDTLRRMEQGSHRTTGYETNPNTGTEVFLPAGGQDQAIFSDSAQVELKDARLSADELALERTRRESGRSAGLVVWLKNTGLKPLEDCSLVIEKLQTLSVKHNEFRDPEFQEQVLLAPRKLAPDGAPEGKSESDGAALARINDAKLTEVVVAVGHRFQGVRETRPRWWRSELLVKGDGRVRREVVFFRWKPGRVPEFTDDPRIHPTPDLKDYV